MCDSYGQLYVWLDKESSLLHVLVKCNIFFSDQIYLNSTLVRGFTGQSVVPLSNLTEKYSNCNEIGPSTVWQYGCS